MELNRHYFERVGDLNPGTYKPDQYQPLEEDFKPGFKEILRIFKDYLIKSDKCLVNNTVIKNMPSNKLANTNHSTLLKNQSAIK